MACAILGGSGCGAVAPYNSQSVRHIHGEWIECVVHVREGCPSFCHTYLWQFLRTQRDNVMSADQPPVEANCACKASIELKQSTPDVQAASVFNKSCGAGTISSNNLFWISIAGFTLWFCHRQPSNLQVAAKVGPPWATFGWRPCHPLAARPLSYMYPLVVF